MYCPGFPLRQLSEAILQLRPKTLQRLLGKGKLQVLEGSSDPVRTREQGLAMLPQGSVQHTLNRAGSHTAPGPPFLQAACASLSVPDSAK